MPAISLQSLNAHRERTFRTAPGARVSDRQEAVAFVNQRGFVYFWPIKGVVLPSLWAAVAGDRPVADAHDDPGHVTWGWKDALLGGNELYYAKVLRKKSTMISFQALPYFYALSENYGSPEHDYLTLYEQGRLTQEARVVYEVLLEGGPMDTPALRRAARLTSRASNSRFARAMADLQTDFKILPVGITQAGSWRYAHAYDVVARHYPDLPDQARYIPENIARKKLVEMYFRSLGASLFREVKKLFGWSAPQVERAVDALVASGVLRRGLQVDQQPGEWIALLELLDHPRTEPQ